jgi:hypothetical protein
VPADALALEAVGRARPRRLLEVRAIPPATLGRLRTLLGAPASEAGAEDA